MIRGMRLTLATVSLLVAFSAACASGPERTPPPLDRSASASATAAASTSTEASAPTTASSSAPATAGAGGTYVVQSGDYLSRIAQDLGVTVTALSEANGITDPTLIYPGQVLAVPGGASGALTPSQLPATAAAAAESTPAGTDAEAASVAASPGFLQRGIDRLPFDLPAAVQDPLDELLVREGGDILAFGIVLTVGGVALYILMWLVASIVQLLRFIAGRGQRGVVAAVRGARAATASAGRGLASVSGVASRLGPGGQALATAGAGVAPADYADYADTSGYETDAEDALHHVASVAAPATIGANAIALAPAAAADEPAPAARLVQRAAPSGGSRGDSTREALAELIESWRRALLLDRDFYTEASSVDATRLQAVRVLIFSTVVGGLGWVSHGGFTTAAAASLALLLGWAVQTGATHILATRGHYAPSNVEGLARAFGFALAPAALLPLTMVPFIGVAVGLAVFGWILAATIVATESTLHLSITEALESTVPGWLVLWVAPLVAVQIVT